MMWKAFFFALSAYANLLLRNGKELQSQKEHLRLIRLAKRQIVLSRAQKKSIQTGDPSCCCSPRCFSYQGVKMFSAQSELIGKQLNGWGVWNLIKIKLKGSFWERSWRFGIKINIFIIAVLFLEEKIGSFCSLSITRALCDWNLMV